MKLKHALLASLIALSPIPALAQDSVTRASAASLQGSVGTAETAAWVAHAGSEFIVGAIKTSAGGAEVILRGASGTAETSAILSLEVIQASGLAVGKSVQVVAESAGFALMAGDALLAYVPNGDSRALIHRSRR